MSPPNIAERLAQEVDVIDEKTRAALSQIGREEKAAAADEVLPIARHRASMAQLKAMGFAGPVIGPATSGRTRWLNPFYGLADYCAQHSACDTYTYTVWLNRKIALTVLRPSRMQNVIFSRRIAYLRRDGGLDRFLSSCLNLFIPNRDAASRPARTLRDLFLGCRAACLRARTVSITQRTWSINCGLQARVKPPSKAIDRDSQDFLRCRYLRSSRLALSALEQSLRSSPAALDLG
jgi:hypothetical protein